MKALMQSGAGMLDMFSKPARTWVVHCPPGMLHGGATSKTFTSVTAFDGYVAELRRLGREVTFPSPAVAKVIA